MRSYILRFTAAAVVVAASLPASAQQTPSITPEARAIIARHLTALGGEKALAPLTSMRAAGALAMPAQGITGTVEIVAARPNKALLKAQIAGIGTLESGFDGERGWTIDPIVGPTLLSGKELDQARFDAVFEGPFHDLARYTSLTVAGTETFDGRKAQRIEAVRVGGDKSTEYFDAETGLHAGSVATRETAMGPIDVTSFVRDYRKTGDILQAHQLVQNMMGVEQVITLERFEFNTVKADAFAMPPAVKALIK
ncbi:MAG: hypothetical protein WD690_20030 [Vicinamibacterales bacterium]